MEDTSLYLVFTSAFPMVGIKFEARLLSNPHSPTSTRIDAFVQESYSPAICKSIMSPFLYEIGYSPPIAFSTSDIMKSATYRALYSEFSTFNDNQKFFQATCTTATAIAECSYMHNSPEVRLQIAKYSWCLVYIEDRAAELLPGLMKFQEGLFRTRRQEHAILQIFQDNLTDMYKWWDPVAANCINVSALDFITGLLVEEDQVYRDMPISDAASSWPYALRRKTGSAEAYAYMLFPEDTCPKTKAHTQVIEDINIIINLMNDLLSYHKEALNGDTNNYIHLRARSAGKALPEVLQDIADELRAINARIVNVLQVTHPESVKTYKHFLMGYTDFHFCSPRYRLKDLELEPWKEMDHRLYYEPRGTHR
ncbi:hypothetical protein CVT26_003213 [Gymnopilus dilepis]|uniref:Terpene synthase n=1 Tax=Gymnopilus dilepis TaxID=231916 RepID=A0A409Y564_9AGAR|nr:hypothetical protein CVT26_003213 [Gymnopilus dilepis]